MAWINLLDLIYPIGSFYFSNQLNPSPSALIGGTWEQIKGAVLGAAGANGFAPAGNYGGNLKITVEQMPAHSHLSGDVYLANFSGSYNSNHTFSWEKNSKVQAESSSTGGGKTLFLITIPFIFGKELPKKFQEVI